MATGLRTTTAYRVNSDINMKNEIKISFIDEKDAPCVAKIEKECFSQPFKESDILEYLKNPIWRFLVAKDEKNVLGYISFTKILDEIQIVNVATAPTFRNIGVGKSLINALIDFSKETEVTKLFLEVRESNMPAINLYKGFGFYEVGVSKNHYKDPTENAILMNLDLE